MPSPTIAPRRILLTLAAIWCAAACLAAGPALDFRTLADGSAEIRWRDSGRPLLCADRNIFLLDSRKSLRAAPREAPPVLRENSAAWATDTAELRRTLSPAPDGGVACRWSMRFLNAIPGAAFIVLECDLYAEQIRMLPPRDGSPRRLLVTPDGCAAALFPSGTIPVISGGEDGSARLRMMWRYRPEFINTVETGIILTPLPDRQ